MGFYSVVGFLRPAIYVFLLPLYLAYFSESEYAIYNLMIDFAAIAMIVVSLKLNTAMVTYYYDFLGEPAKQKKYLGNLYLSSLVLGMITLVVLYFLGEPLFRLVFKDEAIRYFPFGMIVVAYTVLFEANQCYITFLKNEKKIWEFTRIMLIHVLSIVILQFLFIIVLERGVQGALEGILWGNVLVSFYILVKERSLLSLDFDYEVIKNSLNFTVLLIPYLIIYWFLSRGGRFFLEHYTNLNEVAVFALLMILSGVIILAVEAVVNGVRPFLFEQFAKGRQAEKQVISILTKMVVNIPLLFVPLIILISCYMHLISSKEIYQTISTYMPWACLLFFLIVISKLFYQQLLFAKRSSLITVLSFISLIFLIVGYVILIPRYSIWGVLISTIIANAVTIVLFYVFAQKVHYVRYSFNAIVITPAVIFISIFFIYYLFDHMSYSIQSFGVVQFFVATGLIVLLNINNVKEYLNVFNNRSDA